MILFLSRGHNISRFYPLVAMIIVGWTAHSIHVIVPLPVLITAITGIVRWRHMERGGYGGSRGCSGNGRCWRAVRPVLLNKKWVLHHRRCVAGESCLWWLPPWNLQLWRCNDTAVFLLCCNGSSSGCINQRLGGGAMRSIDCLWCSWPVHCHCCSWIVACTHQSCHAKSSCFTSTTQAHVIFIIGLVNGVHQSQIFREEALAVVVR